MTNWTIVIFRQQNTTWSKKERKHTNTQICLYIEEIILIRSSACYVTTWIWVWIPNIHIHDGRAWQHACSSSTHREGRNKGSLRTVWQAILAAWPELLVSRRDFVSMNMVAGGWGRLLKSVQVSTCIYSHGLEGMNMQALIQSTEADAKRRGQLWSFCAQWRFQTGRSHTLQCLWSQEGVKCSRYVEVRIVTSQPGRAVLRVLFEQKSLICAFYV